VDSKGYSINSEPRTRIKRSLNIDLKEGYYTDPNYKLFLDFRLRDGFICSVHPFLPELISATMPDLDFLSPEKVMKL
jgi:hypothetical protein